MPDDGKTTPPHQHGVSKEASESFDPKEAAEHASNVAASKGNKHHILLRKARVENK